jgi:hypothetical protein
VLPPPIVITGLDPVICTSTVPREITGSSPVMTRRDKPGDDEARGAHTTRLLLGVVSVATGLLLLTVNAGDDGYAVAAVS